MYKNNNIKKNKIKEKSCIKNCKIIHEKPLNELDLKTKTNENSTAATRTTANELKPKLLFFFLFPFHHISPESKTARQVKADCLQQN